MFVITLIMSFYETPKKQKPSALAGLVGEVTKMTTYLKIMAH